MHNARSNHLGQNEHHAVLVVGQHGHREIGSLQRDLSLLLERDVLGNADLNNVQLSKIHVPYEM